MEEESKNIIVYVNLIEKCQKCNLYPIQPYKCENPECKKIFCEEHLEKNNKKCLVCNSNVKFDKNLNNNLENAKIKCGRCKKIFSNLKIFNKHECDNNFSCKYCMFLSNDEETFIEHVFNYHKYDIVLEFKE